VKLKAEGRRGAVAEKLSGGKAERGRSEDEKRSRGAEAQMSSPRRGLRVVLVADDLHLATSQKHRVEGEMIMAETSHCWLRRKQADESEADGRGGWQSEGRRASRRGGERWGEGRSESLRPTADDEPGVEIGARDVATLAAEGAEAQGEHDRRSSRAADERCGGAEESASGFKHNGTSVHSSPTPPSHACVH
jgi:hypothetical protein